MDELYIDFKGRLPYSGNSKVLKVIMVMAFVFAVGVAVYLIYGGHWFNYYWVVYGIVLGVECYLNLKGKSLIQFLGRTYLDLNRERLNYRPLLLKKGRSIAWSEVSKVLFLKNRILLLLKSDKKLEVDFSRFTYLEVQQVKEAVRKIARENEIPMV
ncbi:MAG: hypothetical protein ACEPOZ_13575 [Marinifilaceae bacterium]